MKETLLNNFLRISRIPRCSGSEEQIADFFVNIAKENNLYYFKDENNNVLIKKKGNIMTDSLALQTHLDMVCVKKNDSIHNFKKDGIDVIITNDEIVTAKDTTLGADQGVGLAIMLSIIEDKSLKHPDLEFLFTTEEETTFNGVVTFPYSKVDSKRLINLDNDKDDTVVIGSDGDILNEYIFCSDLVYNALPSYRVLIDGFVGGNSGNNIELSSRNAISTMVNILKDHDVYLKSINGGVCENDIATYCEVIINTAEDISDIFKNVNVRIEPIINNFCFNKENTKKIINQILDLKCGFVSQLNSINLVMSSANLGMVRTDGNVIKIYYIFRSMSNIELDEINRYTLELGNGFSVNRIYSDSIWKVNNKSDLLEKYKKIYYKECNEYPKEVICHGGTECSSIMKRIDGVDIISIGANMDNIHTYEEVTYISSWVKIYDFLMKLFEIS